MKNLFLLFIIFFFGFKTQAQKFNYGKVSKEDFVGQSYPSDTSAVAAVLHKKTKCYFVYNEKSGFDCHTENTIRIRIYKTSGLEYANFEVPYYVGWKNINPDVVEFKDCYTHNLINGKVERTKLNSEGTFKETLNEFWKKKSITMPNVSVGSIIDIKYTTKSENISKLPDFQFQLDIPVFYANYTSEIPEIYDYKILLKGYLSISPNQKLEQKNQSYETKISHANASNILNYRAVVSNYEIYEVPSLIEEPYVDNIENYRSTLEQELQSIRAVDPQNNKYFSTTWEDVAKNIFKDERFGKQIEARDYFEKDLSSLVKDDDSKWQKLHKIFQFVQNRMSWNNKFGLFATGDISKVYQNRVGNTADINFILIAMLNHAGLNAAPVILSTRSNGIRMFPSREGLNYVVAGLTIDGSRYLLDASEKLNKPGILPLRAINGTGIMLAKNGYSEIVKTTPVNVSKEVNTIEYTILEDASISGKWRRTLTDYLSFVKLKNQEGSSENQIIEKLENQYNIDIKDRMVEKTSGTDLMTTSESIDFTATHIIDRIGGKIYFSPTLFLTQSKSPFKLEERNYPVDFVFPFKEKYQIKIELPKGYTVEHLPANNAMTLTDNQVIFSYQLVHNDNYIQLVANFEVNTAVISPAQYPSLKKLFQAWIDKQQEKVILIKS